MALIWACQVVVKAAQHRLLSYVAVCYFWGSQRMRYVASRFRDDVRVSRNGLGLTAVQVGAAPHCQARKVT